MDLQYEQITSAMITYRNYISYMTAIARTIASDYIDMAGNENPTIALESLFKYNLSPVPDHRLAARIEPEWHGNRCG